MTRGRGSDVRETEGGGSDIRETERKRETDRERETKTEIPRGTEIGRQSEQERHKVTDTDTDRAIDRVSVRNLLLKIDVDELIDRHGIGLHGRKHVFG